MDLRVTETPLAHSTEREREREGGREREREGGWDEQIKDKINARRQVYKKVVNGREDLWGEYCRLRKEVKLLVIEKKLNIWNELVGVAILCGKQGLAMRGHRDDKVHWDDEGEGPNEGNFVQFIRFRAVTDKVLADQLSKGPKNARYTSKTIQNELVRVAGDKIRTDILEEVKHAKFYSIIADEVTDASNKEELSLVIRYALPLSSYPHVPGFLIF